MHQMLQPQVPGNKLTQKDNADSGVQFITRVGPRQSPLLAKNRDQFLWKPYVKTHLPKFLETSLDKVKERYDQS